MSKKQYKAIYKKGYRQAIRDVIGFAFLEAVAIMIITNALLR